MMDGIKLSVFDVIKQNFSLAGLNTYIHKVYYTGEHNYSDEAETQLTNLFTEGIKSINKTYCDAPVTGFLLIYQKYYISMIEGSEETISRQIKKFVFEPSNHAKFGRSKVLSIYHNITERQFQDVFSIFKIPPTLASALDRDNSLEYFTHILESIVDKMERLVLQISNFSNMGSADGGGKSMEVKLDTLPEYALLEFILASRYCLELRNFAIMAENIPDYQYSFEKCWPTPYDFTPIVNYERELPDTFVDNLPKSIYDVEEEVVDEDQLVDAPEKEEEGSADEEAQPE